MKKKIMIALHKQNNNLREHILKKYAVHENVSFRYLPEPELKT